MHGGDRIAAYGKEIDIMKPRRVHTPRQHPRNDDAASLPPSTEEAQHDHERLYGRQPVRELLRARRRTIHRVTLLDSAIATPELREIEALAERASLTGVEVEPLIIQGPTVKAIVEKADDLDADVMVFSEYTPEHRTTLVAHPVANRYPYKINRDSLFAGGMALWSKYALTCEGAAPHEDRLPCRR